MFGLCAFLFLVVVGLGAFGWSGLENVRVNGSVLDFTLSVSDALFAVSDVRVGTRQCVRTWGVASENG